MLDGKLIAVCGFCSGDKEDSLKKPGRYPRGFLKRALAFDIRQPASAWQELPEFPGEARQGLFCARVNDRLYFWGGFNYSQPYCYSDGWALSKHGQNWEALPALPWKLTSASACASGRKFTSSAAPITTERTASTPQPTGRVIFPAWARLLMIDTAKLDAGWQRLADCPGTPRFVHAMQALHGKIYVIGGATGGSPTRTVVDNWVFDPADNHWRRIRDLPISSGNFPKSCNLVFDDRFIILVGGYQYGDIANPDGTNRPNYGSPSHRNPGSGLNNDVFIYDTQDDRFGTADKLPIDNNLPMTVV